MVDCAGRLVAEAFCSSDQVVIDVMQRHGCSQSCMPKSVERLLEVHEDMVKGLLVLQVFLTEYSKTENLLSCAPSCSETCYKVTKRHTFCRFLYSQRTSVLKCKRLFTP